MNIVKGSCCNSYKNGAHVIALLYLQAIKGKKQTPRTIFSFKHTNESVGKLLGYILKLIEYNVVTTSNRHN